MKKILIVFFLLLGVAVGCADAYEYKRISTDARILAALDVLNQTGSYETLDKLFPTGKSKKVTKIMFYELSMLSYEYKNHFAAACTDEMGDKYILINNKYKNAPKEALAALIAHEATHEKAKADYEEEVRAWTNETLQWIKCQKLNPNLADENYANDTLVKRLNNLAALYADAGSNTMIAQKIENNSFYKTQLVR